MSDITAAEPGPPAGAPKPGPSAGAPARGPARPSRRHRLAALEPLLSDRALRRTIGERGRTLVHARFSPTLWVQETRAVYDAVLAEPSLRVAWRGRPA